MKTSRYTILAAAAIALAACSKNDDTLSGNGNYPSDNIVRITTSVSDLVSRSGETALPYTGTDLSLSIDYGTGDKYTLPDVKWTTSDGGKTWSAATQMLWKSPSDAARIYAYAPYVAGVTDIRAVAFSVQTDQMPGSASSDLIGYVNTSFVPGSSLSVKNELNITFGHKLSKLTLNLTYGDQFGTTPPAIASVALAGTKTGAVYDATQGTVSPAGDIDEIIMHKIADGKYDVVFVPQSVAAGERMVTVTLDNGQIYYYAVTAGGHSFASGSAYSMKLQVGKDKLEIASEGVTVTDWTQGTDIPGGEADIDPVWDGKAKWVVKPLAANTYNIKYAAEWVWLSDEISTGNISTKNLVINLTDDLDFGGFEMRPLGFLKDTGGTTLPAAQYFWGKLNGNGHTVKGLKITTGRYKNVGFISQLNPGSEVHDLTVECEMEGNVNNDGMAKGVAGVAGTSIGALVENCTVRGSISSGAIGVYMGGVIGYFRGGTMLNCVNYATVVTKSSVSNITGGITGCVGEYPNDGTYDFPSYIIACRNHGSIRIQGSGRAGGFAGESPHSSTLRSFFIACYNTGFIEDMTFTGKASGLIYSNGKDSEFYGCYNAGVLPAYGSIGVGGSPVNGSGVYAISDESDDLPASVGMAASATNCGKKTGAALNSQAVISAMNQAISDYNAAHPAHKCMYVYEAGELTPSLVAR